MGGFREKIDDNKRHLTRLGSTWGGLHLDIALVTPSSTVISAGLARDISFDVDLITRRKCHIVGIDPTRAAWQTVRTHQIISLFKQIVSGTLFPDKQFALISRAIHHTTGITVRLGGPAKTFLSPVGEKAVTISINDVLAMYPGASVLKLDIEGAEFPVLEGLSFRPRVPQIAIGFHVWLNGASDRCPNEGVVPSIFTPKDVIDSINKIKGFGYKLVYEGREEDDRIGQETLFVRQDLADKYHDIELTA